VHPSTTTRSRAGRTAARSVRLAKASACSRRPAAHAPGCLRPVAQSPRLARPVYRGGVWSRRRVEGPRQQVAEESAAELRRSTAGLPPGFVVGMVAVAVTTMCMVCAAGAVLARFLLW
jgi:hypothetical protein